MPYGGGHTSLLTCPVTEPNELHHCPTGIISERLRSPYSSKILPEFEGHRLRLGCWQPRRPGYPFGSTFWFMWKRLSGSYFRLTSTSLS